MNIGTYKHTETVSPPFSVACVLNIHMIPLPHIISHSDVGVTGRSESPLREGTSEGNETGENLLEQVFGLL